jgi:hypothetical protein
MKRGLCLALVVAASVGATAAYASSRGGDLQNKVTIRAQELDCGQPGTECGFVDQAPAGTSLGDGFTFNVPAVRDGHRVGTHAGTCTQISLAGSGTDECQVTAAFRPGTIQLDGLFHFGGPGTRSNFAVTGGTGLYPNARGQATVITGTTTNTVVIHLIP